MTSELAEALIASLADAVYFVDAAGEVSFVNPAALQVLGYDDELELLGCDSHATIHSHYRDGAPFCTIESLNWTNMVTLPWGP